jgi:transposase
MQIAVMGIDLGNNTCSLVGLDGDGRVIMRKRLRRESIIAFTARAAPCVVGTTLQARNPQRG